jgi:hypothetical protein
MTFRKWLGTACVVLAIAATSDCVTAGSATPDSIIVMPARKRVVQLAFQMASFKDIGLVTYNTNPALREPLIHYWNGNNQEWVQMTMQDFVQGSFMSGDPKHVFLLGDSTITPLKMLDGISWYKDLHRLTTFDTATLINEIGKVVKFSARQWKWLAKENGLEIQDQNAERRKYGRWGAPGKEKDLKPNSLESIKLPPAPIIVEPKAEKFELPPAQPTAPAVDAAAKPQPVDVKFSVEEKPIVEEKPAVQVKPVVVVEPVVEVKPAVEVKPVVEAPKPATPAVAAPDMPATGDVEPDDNPSTIK